MADSKRMYRGELKIKRKVKKIVTELYETKQEALNKASELAINKYNGKTVEITAKAIVLTKRQFWLYKKRKEHNMLEGQN